MKDNHLVRFTLILLSASLLNSVGLPQGTTDPATRPKPGAWRFAKPYKTTSKEWMKNKDNVDRLSGFWKNASREQRHQAISKQLAYYDKLIQVTAYDAYLLGRLALEFPTDFVEVEAMAFASAAQRQTAGSHDPEFVRVAFQVCSFYGGGTQLHFIAPLILEIYPKDTGVKHAFVREAWRQSKPSWEVVQLAMKVFETLLGKRLVPSVRAESYWSNLWIAAYDATKELSHLQEAIRRLEESIRSQPDASKRASAEKLLGSMKRKLASGDYKEG